MCKIFILPVIISVCLNLNISKAKFMIKGHNDFLNLQFGMNDIIVLLNVDKKTQIPVEHYLTRKTIYMYIYPSNKKNTNFFCINVKFLI